MATDFYGGVLQGVQNPYGTVGGAIQGAGNAQGALNAAGLSSQAAAAQSAAVTAMIRSGKYGNGDTAWLRATQAYAQQQQPGTLNTMNLGTSAANVSGNAAAGAQPSPFTVIGQSDPWLNANELGAKTDALGGIGGASGGGASGGGGGGMPAGASAGSGTGMGTGTSSGSGVLGGMSGGTTANNNPAFNQATGQYGLSPTNTYQSPQMGAIQPGQGGAIQMQQASPQNALQNYYNTPGYQLLGNNQAQQFQASPGYQYAVNQALGQVQQNASARGLLESGAALRGMTDRAQGMASQEYNNWWNQQSQLYGDYQNRLQGLAGGSTGGDQAYGLGMAQGANSMQTGSNLGSLFGNQGNAGLSGMVAAGGAQANNMLNAGAQQAQINSANQATRLAGAVASQPQRTGLF